MNECAQKNAISDLCKVIHLPFKVSRLFSVFACLELQHYNQVAHAKPF